MTNDNRQRQRALFLWGGFFRCPTTNRILECLEGDDKVMCGCGRSNPRCPQERTEQTGTHVVRYLTAATVDEYLAQEKKRRSYDP